MLTPPPLSDPRAELPASRTRLIAPPPATRATEETLLLVRSRFSRFGLEPKEKSPERLLSAALRVMSDDGNSGQASEEIELWEREMTLRWRGKVAGREPVSRLEARFLVRRKEGEAEGSIDE